MSKLVVKVIKEKEFTANDEQHTHYAVAYKGRVFGVNTLRIPKDEIKVDNGVMTLSGEYELKKDIDTDMLTGETKSYLQLYPKLDLALSDV